MATPWLSPCASFRANVQETQRDKNFKCFRPLEPGNQARAAIKMIKKLSGIRTGIAPCGHACDGKLLALAAAPQSAAASCSDLRPFV